jgi:uncharacterized protein YhbP (UPF0306 family)
MVSPAYALVGNVSTANVEPVSSSEQINEMEKSQEVDKVIEYTEKELESNYASKAYQIDGSDKNNYLVEGGNENAVNSLATNQNIAQGTVVESTNVEGVPYDLEILSEEEKSNKNALELRQFVSFQTKSGKVFHLIIDHSKSTDNVIMLTEVGEQDLLNLIEENAEVALILDQEVSEDDKKTVVTNNESNLSVEENTIDEIAEGSKNNTNLIIILAASVIAGVAGWYIKIYKPKHNSTQDEEIDEADYIEDETYVDDEEND